MRPQFGMKLKRKASGGQKMKASPITRYNRNAASPKMSKNRCLGDFCLKISKFNIYN